MGWVKRQVKVFGACVQACCYVGKGWERIVAHASLFCTDTVHRARRAVFRCARPPGQGCGFVAIGAKGVFCFRCAARHACTSQGPREGVENSDVFLAWAPAMLHFKAEFDLAVRARSDIDSVSGAMSFPGCAPLSWERGCDLIYDEF